MTHPPFLAETLLLLAERPGDEVRRYGELIASLCRAGRPPFVVVLTDGWSPDPEADRRVAHGLAALGLEGRMLMFGIPGAMPPSGPVFDAAVRALCFISWRHDCNVLCLPGDADPAVHALARAAGAENGLGLAQADAGHVRLVASPRRSARPGEA